MCYLVNIEFKKFLPILLSSAMSCSPVNQNYHLYPFRNFSIKVQFLSCAKNTPESLVLQTFYVKKYQESINFKQQLQ